MPLDIFAYLLGLLFFGVAAIQDWRHREVENYIWAVYSPFAMAITIWSVMVAESMFLLVFAVSFMAVNAAIAISLFYGKVWGGGDSKAFTCLGMAFPFEYLLIIGATMLCSTPFLVHRWKQKDKKEYPIVTILFFGILIVGFLKIMAFMWNGF